jgi:acetyl-CoA synthetase
MTPYTRVKNTSYDPGHVSIKWYEDGLLNVSANCRIAI